MDQNLVRAWFLFETTVLVCWGRGVGPGACEGMSDAISVQYLGFMCCPQKIVDN